MGDSDKFKNHNNWMLISRSMWQFDHDHNPMQFEVDVVIAWWLMPFDIIEQGVDWIENLE